ncbi:uncharacterized protein LOC143378442 [Andrena cerasifolii]|uniref:uncharacterized protein LOC143378442 n=1 Tax=Andrena cerasifolii TaxID=2819439 RepID=UPI004037E477
MFHRPECRRYRQWKRDQASKLLGSRKVEEVKRRRRQPVDCIDEDEEEHVTKAELKIKSRECKRKRKRSSKGGSKAQRVKQITKHVSLADLFLKCIKPPIEVRQQLLNPRHIACLQDTPSKMDIAAEIMEATTSVGWFLPRQPRRTRFRRGMPGRRRPVARKRKDVGEKVDQEEGKAEEKPDDEAAGGSKAQKRLKGKRRRRKVACRKAWKKKDSDDDSECDSICSFHSEVCLGGLKLTLQDKKKIEAYQRQTKDA